MLPSTSEAAALQIAEKLRSNIASVEFKHQGGTFNVTVSLGIASVIPPIGSDCERLFTLADLALYKAKENGRNRYEVADLTDWHQTSPSA